MCKIHPIYSTRLEEGTPFLPLHKDSQSQRVSPSIDHRSRLSAFRLLYCTTSVLTVTLLLLYELLKYITPYLRSAKEQYFVP